MRHATVLSLIAALALVLTGCGKDSPPSPTPGSGSGGAGGPANGSMTATIDGVPWAATTIFAGVGPSAGTPGGQLLTVQGTNGLQNLIFILNETGSATYSEGTGPVGTNIAFSLSNQTWMAIRGAGDGSTYSINLATITSTGASGSFAFKGIALPGATGTKTVTNGVFNVRF